MKQKLLELLRSRVRQGIEVTESARLREDLDLNSLAMMMLLWETEELLGRELDITAFAAAKTVEDFLNVIRKGESGPWS